MTLVKYMPPDAMLTVRCRQFKSCCLSAKTLTAAGLGDNTVQDDKTTVWVAHDQYVNLIRPLIHTR